MEKTQEDVKMEFADFMTRRVMDAGSFLGAKEWKETDRVILVEIRCPQKFSNMLEGLCSMLSAGATMAKAESAVFNDLIARGFKYHTIEGAGLEEEVDKLVLTRLNELIKKEEKEDGADPVQGE